MNVVKVLNEWKGNIVLLFVLAVLSAVILYLFGNFIAVFHEHSKSFASMIKAREEYNRFIIRKKELPSKNLITKYQKHAEEIEQLYKELLTLLSQDKKAPADISTLEFKERLLSIQQEFREKAEQRGIALPVDLGFKEYMGQKIPSEKAIPLLGLQLELITMLVDQFLASGIERIESIVRRDYEKDKTYKRRLPFNFTLKTDMKGLISVLNAVQARPEILIVDNLNIDTIPLDTFRREKNLGHLLEVSFEISYVNLNNNKK